MAALRDTDLMPFGLHRGKQMIDVPAKYLLYLKDNGLRKGNVMSYILDNLEVLEKEVAEEKEKRGNRRS